MIIQFFVPGNPQALKRHRTYGMKTKKGYIVRQVDPSKETKQDFLAMCLNHRPEKPIDKNIKMDLAFHFSRPKSHLNAKGLPKVGAPSYHTSRPDIDNLEKLVMDALNGTFYKDDSQVCVKRSIKMYTSETPGVHVKISDMTDSPV